MGKILGQGIAWEGWATKINLIKSHLEETSDEIVLYTDCRDVVFAATEQEILDTFLSTNTRILFGAETNIYPNKELQHGNPNDRYRYLNAGTFMGYTNDLLKLFKTMMGPYSKPVDDQELLHERILTGKYKISLDTKCEVFQNLWDEHGGRSCNFDILYQPDYIENLYTKTRPKIFHAPGPTTVLSQANKVVTRTL